MYAYTTTKTLQTPNQTTTMTTLQCCGSWAVQASTELLASGTIWQHLMVTSGHLRLQPVSSHTTQQITE